MVSTWLCLFLAVSGAFATRTYKCSDGKCTKEFTDDTSVVVSLEECKLTCLPYGGLWPAPTGELELSKELVTVKIGGFRPSTFKHVSDKKKKMIADMEKVFSSLFKTNATEIEDEYIVYLYVDIEDENVEYFKYGVDESYSISIAPSSTQDRILNATITAPTFIGAMHAANTYSQLVAYDDIHSRLRTVKSGKITDKPFYKHRGISIDTARTYFPLESIYKILDGMSYNKLNSLHWHITDTQSFPYLSDAYPSMAADGAYSASQVYTPDDIKAVVAYAKARGIRVTPELDAPAHVGEGWVTLDPDLITCFRWEPWTQYCVEPPCGQFNPIKDRLYDILSTIYQEYAELFKSDLFHMGGDEVNLNCWKSTESITKWMTDNNIPVDDNGFHKIWEIYQNRSFEQLKNANPKATPVLWTSTLTEHPNAPEILDPATYIIQIWTTRNNQETAKLIRNKYKVIFSNYDELYMDCGGGAWIGGPGQNWCSPYVGWQSVYGHDPINIIEGLGVQVTEEVQEQLLGSEAALWTEQVDGQTLDGRLWPRAAALAERLWTRPNWAWTDAQYRMNHHRERLVRSGLRAELLQMAWCYHNDGFCGLGV